MPPLIIAWVIDSLTGNIPAFVGGVFGIESAEGAIVLLASMVMIVFAFESVFEWLFQRGFMRLAQDTEHSLRMDAYARLQQKEMAYFENNRTGDLMAMLNDDINQLERFLNDSFNQIIQLTVLFLFSGVILFGSSWELAAISLTPIPFILWGSVYYQRMISPYYKEVRQSVGALSNRLENNISGMAVIKSFTAEDFERERMYESSERYRAANYNAIRYSSLYVPLIRMLIALGFAIVVLIGGYWTLQGKLTMGQITLFTMMIQRVLWPVTRLGKIFDELERARASAARVFGLMDADIGLTDVEQPTEIPQSFTGDIRLDKVSFHYAPELPILDRVDLHIASGETIGIAGTTGAGKTTITKLLLRLYDVTGGSIQIDGIDIRQFRQQDLRRQIAVVSQDVYLFHGTIGENIAYGMPAASAADIEAASKKAQLHEFVASLPEAYDSIVGERGIKLSGGQRQRLSIARAILKDAPILVLDEATSAVDTETERAIQLSLNQLTANRTAIIIAHRLSTIRHADRIVVLSGGGIAEQGSHEELMAIDNGIYAELCRVQIGEMV